jgi:hypothetical protein
MSLLHNVTKGFIRAKPTFATINPSIYAMFTSAWVKYLAMTPTIVKGTIGIVKRELSVSEFCGDLLAYSLISSTVNRRLWLGGVQKSIRRAHLITQQNKSYKLNGLGATRRTWITVNDKSLVDERIVKQLTIIYHDANKAGKHVDVHLGHLSMVYRVSGKPFEKDLKFNSKGRLTEASKDILLNHIRSEIKKNARVPWNHDHTISNARMDWDFDETLKSQKGYGAGATRQVIAQSTVEFYHPEVTSSLHMYCPLINPNQGLYIYKIYEGKQGGTPILIWGNLIPRDEKFRDRLHLNMIQDADYKTKFLERVDHGTITRKYDGASAYCTSSGEIEKGHSFKIFSPRMSKETGHRIEYTYKAAELATNGGPDKAQGMGELQFYQRTIIGRITQHFGFRGAERICWNYLPAASVGGILNSNATRPRDVFPEYRLYRIDKWNGIDTYDLPFFENRELQERLVSKLDQRFWKVVKLVRPQRNTNWEGLVGVEAGDSINNGHKVKWWADANDWQVKSIDLKLSDKGNIAGVVNFISLNSGKEFKLGPGNIGSVDRCMDMLRSPDDFIGRVYKVHGRNGHEGRAAKIVDEHLDKGEM